MLERRALLQIGGSSFLGLGLSNLLTDQANASNSPQHQAKSVILVFLTGGGPHIDMFDPKPESPEIKGDYQPIDTSIAGIRFTDRMPQMAKRVGKLAVLRSLSHGDNRHLSGSHNTLTGAVQPFRGSSNQDKSLNRADWPSYGSALSYLAPRTDGLPSQVTLPNPLIEGALVWPGQHAGFLGPQHDPFVLKYTPNNEGYEGNPVFKPIKAVSLIGDLDAERLEQQRSLLSQIKQGQAALNASPSGRRYATQQERAYSMLTSSRLTRALDITRETDTMRERYGRHFYGQTLLLARRLVELEMPVIQCNMGRVQTWDTHVDHFGRLKNMLPYLDAGVSALVDDLDERGLLDQTLVVCVGEFGRTPSISPLAGQTKPGRHHWAHGYTAIVAGAGVRGGQVIGKTDRKGAYPVTTPYHPNDLGATIYNALGIDLASNVPDRLDRPRRLNDGEVIESLYTGAPT